MKNKAAVLCCLMSVVVLFAGLQYSQAESKTDKPSSKIGIVSVRKTFRSCKRNSQYREQAIAEQTKLKAEEDRASKETEAMEAALKALKPGSSDQLARYKDLLDKRAALEVQRQFNNQQRILKDRQWTEGLYKEILKITGELAQQKGMELVLEVDEPEFPVESGDELMMTLNTHKGGCLDLTSEVVARLDAQEGTAK